MSLRNNQAELTIWQVALDRKVTQGSQIIGGNEGARRFLWNFSLGHLRKTGKLIHIWYLPTGRAGIRTPDIYGVNVV
jgi:hypothetical protein